MIGSHVIRPKLGFILEGKSEFVSYPTLVAKIIPGENYVPRVLARGNGAVIKHLEQHLDDLYKSHGPHKIIITLDLRDALEARASTDCASLRETLQARAEGWLDGKKCTEPCGRLPDQIIVIIQVPEFEIWMLTDPDGLIRSGLFETRPDVPDSDNIDVLISKPYRRVMEHIRKPHDTKKGITAKQIMQQIHLDKMRQSSRSFRKLLKEILAAYQTGC